MNLVSGLGWLDIPFIDQRVLCQLLATEGDSQRTIHYYHSAITPVVVKPGSPHVLPLPPEFIVPQDGHEKQDCERVKPSNVGWRHIMLAISLIQ